MHRNTALVQASQLGMLRVYAGDDTPAEEMIEKLKEVRKAEVRRVDVAKALSFVVKTENGAVIRISADGSNAEVFEDPAEAYSMYLVFERNIYLKENVNQDELPAVVRDKLDNLPQSKDIKGDKLFIAIQKPWEAIEPDYQDTLTEVSREREAVKNAVTFCANSGTYYDVDGQELAKLDKHSAYIVSFSYHGKEICKPTSSLGIVKELKKFYRAIVWSCSQFRTKEPRYRKLEYVDAVRDLLPVGLNGLYIKVSSEYDTRFDRFKKGLNVGKFIGYGILFLIVAKIL